MAPRATAAVAFEPATLPSVSTAAVDLLAWEGDLLVVAVADSDVKVEGEWLCWVPGYGGQPAARRVRLLDVHTVAVGRTAAGGRCVHPRLTGPTKRTHKPARCARGGGGGGKQQADRVMLPCCRDADEVASIASEGLAAIDAAYGGAVTELLAAGGFEGKQVGGSCCSPPPPRCCWRGGS